MKEFLTFAWFLPMLAISYAALHRDDKAEAGHVAGLALGVGVVGWLIWASAAILWLIWR